MAHKGLVAQVVGRDLCIRVASLVLGGGILFTLCGCLVQLGRVMERLERVERAATSYVQTVEMQGVVTRLEYQQLRDIHVRAGDIQ
jgi:hypothetical protein